MTDNVITLIADYYYYFNFIIIKNTLGSIDPEG